jgi:hypothetical protein
MLQPDTMSDPIRPLSIRHPVKSWVSTILFCCIFCVCLPFFILLLGKKTRRGEENREEDRVTRVQQRSIRSATWKVRRTTQPRAPPTCPFCPRLPCWAYLCLFVCLSNAWKHTFARQIFPLWEKKGFFCFPFYFQEDSVRLVVSSLVAPCHLVHSLLRPRTSFLIKPKKIRNFIFLREEKLLDARRHQSKGLVPWFTAPEVSIYLNVPFWFEFF